MSRGHSAAVCATVQVRSIDWRQRGAVKPIVDQGECGASWAFAAAATIEAREMIIHSRDIDASEEHLKDCV